MFTDDMYRLDLDQKFVISQLSEELRLELADWDWDVEGERTCILFSCIQRLLFECS